MTPPVVAAVDFLPRTRFELVDRAYPGGARLLRPFRRYSALLDLAVADRDGEVHSRLEEDGPNAGRRVWWRQGLELHVGPSGSQHLACDAGTLTLIQRRYAPNARLAAPAEDLLARAGLSLASITGIQIYAGACPCEEHRPVGP